MKKIKLVPILVALFFAMGNAWANPIGTLTLENGILKLRRNNIDTVYRDPASAIPVENGDEIQTGPESRATISLTAQADNIELFSNSFFKIAAVKKTKSIFRLPLGKARFRVNKSARMGKKRRFRVRTANAMIGVKGTDFIVGVSGGDTNVLTLSGLVAMASLAAPNVEVDVQANQASKIQQNRTPTKPVVVPPQVQESIVSDDTPEAFEAVEFGEEAEAEPETAAKKKTMAEEDKEAKEEGDADDDEESGDDGTVSEAGEDDAGITEAGDTAESDAVDTPVDIEDTTETDDLIDDITETVDDVQEDVEGTQTNTRTVDFTIIRQ